MSKDTSALHCVANLPDDQHQIVKWHPHHPSALWQAKWPLWRGRGQYYFSEWQHFHLMQQPGHHQWEGHYPLNFSIFVCFCLFPAWILQRRKSHNHQKWFVTLPDTLTIQVRIKPITFFVSQNIFDNFPLKYVILTWDFLRQKGVNPLILEFGYLPLVFLILRKCLLIFDY